MSAGLPVISLKSCSNPVCALHTWATSLFRAGLNAKQVQAWLWHHAASFTMDTYVHLLPDDVGEAPESFDVIGPNYMSTQGAEAVTAQVIW